MSERANTDTDSERVPERVLCPNCPADLPRPFSSREVRCRRCETTFVAPDEARAAAAIDDGGSIVSTPNGPIEPHGSITTRGPRSEAAERPS